MYRLPVPSVRKRRIWNILRSPLVVLVQAAQHRNREGCHCLVRKLLLDSSMWSSSVEVPHLLMKHAPQVTLMRNDDVVQTLAAKAAKKPFADRIGPRSLEEGAEYVDPAPDRHWCEDRPECCVIVADEIGGTLVERGGFTELLGDPGIGRMSRRAHMDHAARGRFHDDEGVDRPEEQVGHHDEIARPDARGVVVRERGPGLPMGSWWAGTARIFLDRPFGQANAEI
jgi:hypothetical protein